LILTKHESAPTNNERALIKDMQSFVLNAKENSLRTDAHGIRSINRSTTYVARRAPGFRRPMAP